VTLVVVHRIASLLRFASFLGELFDHRTRVLVVEGEIRHGRLRRCGLTDNDSTPNCATGPNEAAGPLG